MNLIIIKDRLKDALSVLSRATSNKNSLPILKNILIDVTKEEINFIATDLEIGIRYQVRGKVIEEGTVTVPADTLTKIVNNITHDRLNLSLDGNVLKITTDDYDAKINTTPPDDFPIIPEVKNQEKSLVIDAGLLKEILEKVASAAQFSDLRPELNSVLIDFSMDSLIFTSTDSFRLAEYTLSGGQFDTNETEDFKILIPLSTALNMAYALPSEGKVELFYDNTQILFKTESFSLISRLVEGNFPEYKNIIPKEFNAEFVVSKENLLNAVKLASVFSGETNDTVVRKTGKKQVEVFSHADAKGENVSRIPAKITGDFEEIKFNWKYLNKGVSVIDAEDIWVGIINESKPALFRAQGDSRFFYLLMPILSE